MLDYQGNGRRCSTQTRKLKILLQHLAPLPADPRRRDRPPLRNPIILRLHPLQLQPLPTRPADEASSAARVIEAQAFSAADVSSVADGDVDGKIETLSVYAKEISKRALEMLKSRATQIVAAGCTTYYLSNRLGLSKRLEPFNRLNSLEKKVEEISAYLKVVKEKIISLSDDVEEIKERVDAATMTRATVATYPWLIEPGQPLGTQLWIKSLNLSIVDEWRQWLVDDQVEGFTPHIFYCKGKSAIYGIYA
ncbi:mfp1 attachment factor 1 [Quercus suber]|uniref:Mfp1 attachment factor 1 n=1 Tax=Quercus suber TaxID=58331 RepID=A0AAW0LMU3_QUESU